jgi:hypothetical protein
MSPYAHFTALVVRIRTDLAAKHAYGPVIGIWHGIDQAGPKPGERKGTAMRRNACATAASDFVRRLEAAG